MRIVAGKLGLLSIIVGVLIAGCGRTATPARPTPAVRFVTMTPGGPGAGFSPSPTTTASPTAPAATLTPTVTDTPFLPPTAIPTSTPLPTPSATPVVVTSTPAYAYAVIKGPSGFVNVREAPGFYEVSLGAYNNGAEVDIIGKQYSPEGELWWLIPFYSSPYGQGWIYADYTVAYNTYAIPWVTAPSRATPTPIEPPIPHAIIDSPDGFTHIRNGPGDNYDPPLGRFSNGRFVDIIGKQLSTTDQLWWLIPFPASPNGGGWIYANDTIAKNTRIVPWVAAPPTPTPTATSPSTPDRVDWTISGQVIDARTGQPIPGAFVGATLGTEGISLSSTTGSNGRFLMVGRARDAGELVLNLAAEGYRQRTLTADPASPRVYDFSTIELNPQEAPVVAWAIFGRVIESETLSPVAGAQVEAFLGEDAVRLETNTNAAGEFALNGQARDEGTLSLTVSAEGYQSATITSNQTDSRIYNLSDLQLAPQAGTCRYESVVDLVRSAALARLQTLNFTNVTTGTVDVGGDQSLLDRVVDQEPEPPSAGQSVRLSCQAPIVLHIGGQTPSQ